MKIKQLLAAIAIAISPILSYSTYGALTTSIGYSSNFFSKGETSFGSSLNDYYFSLGAFSAGFTPTLSNVSLWDQNFTALTDVYTSAGYTQWVDEGGGYGEYQGSVDFANNNAPFTLGATVYVWGYNTKTVGTGTEWILLTDPSWQFPAAPPSTVTLGPTFTTGATTIAIVGSWNDSESIIKTAAITAVPEPTSVAFMAMGGAMVLGAVLRRRKALV